MPSPIKPLIKQEPGYSTWETPEQLLSAMGNIGGAIVANGSVQSFTNIDTNTSVRPEFHRGHYEYFRPSEALPVSKKDRISRANDVYETVGLIRHIVDLMADFASQGMRINHPQESVQKFYRLWAQKVNLRDRGERFLNLLYRLGNVVVKINYGTIKLKNSNLSGLDKIDNKRIPASYSFLNPTMLEVIGNDLAAFTGSLKYAVRIPSHVRTALRNPRPELVEMMDLVPPDILNSTTKNDLYPLDMSTIRTFFYKKDDWEVWADPMIFPILKDIIMLDKLKMADIAACDGIISKVRIWRLGSLEHKILPNPAVIAKLAAMLENNVAGGSKDLIWGPDIELKESDTNTHQFLGDEKYKPTLNSIYVGLGIPPTLTGNSGNSGFSNNFISLKTLLERLEYGRSKLVEFLNEQFAMIAKEMGFKEPALVDFDKTTLSDEASIKQLYLHLWDRDIVTTETIREIFNIPDKVEDKRMRRQMKKIDKSTIPEKAGPYHKGGFDEDIKKMLIENGIVDPRELGVDIPEDVKIDFKKMRPKPSVAQPAQKGEPGAGRPKNTKDSSKRKDKVIKPKIGKAHLIQAWAKEAQDYVSDIVTPAVLGHYNKKNVRSLSVVETESLENMKFCVLCNLEPLSDLAENTILEVLENNNGIPSFALEYSQALKTEFSKLLNKELNTDNIRQIHYLTYLQLKGTENGQD